MIPLPYKLLGIAAIGILVYSGGHYQGAAGRQKVWDKAIADQTILNQKQEIANNERTLAAATAYAADNILLRDALDRMRTQPANSLPTTPNHTSDTDAASEKFARACTSPIYTNALGDAQQLNALTQLLRELGLPVQ